MRYAEHRIDKLAFTGGVATGRAILAQLATRGIPSVMELSGNDALIVCADADIEGGGAGGGVGADLQRGAKLRIAATDLCRSAGVSGVCGSLRENH